MSVEVGRFYFGSAGDLQPLPMLVAGGNPAVGPTRYGSLTRTLRGTPSIVTYGNRRSWPLSWDYMYHADANLRTLQRVEAVYRQWVQRRAYLLDTRQTNALQPDVASCGGELGTENFAATTGVVTRSNSAALHTDLFGLCEGNLNWTPGATGSGRQVGCNPMLPIYSGSSYLFSAYVNTSVGGSGSVKPTFFFYDKDRALLGNVQSSTATTLSTTAARCSFLLPSGSVLANSATFQVGFTTTATTTALNTAGWQVEYDPGESSPASWCMGAGGAEVVVSEYSVLYPDAFGRRVSAVFQEV